MAGLRWQPEMCPMAKAMVRTVSPKANATPAKPMPTAGNPAASTAAPHPPKTSQNVPKNSANARLLMGMRSLLFGCICEDPLNDWKPTSGGKKRSTARRESEASENPGDRGQRPGTRVQTLLDRAKTGRDGSVKLPSSRRLTTDH